MELIELFEKESSFRTYEKYINNPNIFVHFTNIDKVGINPKTVFKTPVGVYTYPLSYVYKMRWVPWGNRFKYIFLLEATKSIFDIDNCTARQYHNVYKKIKELNPYTDIDKVVEEYNSNYVGYADSDSHWKNSFGFKLWNLTYIFSNNNPILWNKLLREVGLDIISDNGAGIIHKNEPTQTLFLTPSSFKIKEKLNNDNDEIENDPKDIIAMQFMLDDNPDNFYEMFIKHKTARQFVKLFTKRGVKELKPWIFSEELEDVLTNHNYTSFLVDLKSIMDN